MHRPLSSLPISRREMLRRCGAGFGTLGLAALLGERPAYAAEPADPLASRPPHFRARAKYVIQILANGGPAQMDTFDPKPLLTKYHGQRLPIHLATERPTSMTLAPSAKNSLAVASPMPPVAPVMIAVLPCKFAMILLSEVEASI